MAVDLAQRGVAACFRGHDHAVEALDIGELEHEAVGDEALEHDALRGKMLLDGPDRAALARGPAAGEAFGLIRSDRTDEARSERAARAPDQQAGLEAAQAERLPDQIDDVAHPDLLENVGGPHRRGHAQEKLVVARRILALDERRRPERDRRKRGGRREGGGIGGEARSGNIHGISVG